MKPSTIARAQSSTGALVPSTPPECSLARTAKYEWWLCANIAVSKPFRGVDPKGSIRFGLGPEVTSHVATEVAPFQLAYRATLSSDLRSAATAGASVGRPLQGKRKAR